MRYVLTLAAVLICLGAQGCVSQKLAPPDHVLDPRGN
jgi:hypothetical protein